MTAPTRPAEPGTPEAFTTVTRTSPAGRTGVVEDVVGELVVVLATADEVDVVLDATA